MTTTKHKPDCPTDAKIDNLYNLLHHDSDRWTWQTRYQIRLEGINLIRAYRAKCAEVAELEIALAEQSFGEVMEVRDAGLTELRAENERLQKQVSMAAYGHHENYAQAARIERYEALREAARRFEYATSLHEYEITRRELRDALAALEDNDE